MRSRLTQAIVIGVLTGIAGVGLFASPPGAYLEEAVGLDALFLLRGPRLPPREVLIVGIDRSSAERMNLPADSGRLPRSFHARLIDRLAAGGAAVIVFDIVFEEIGFPEEDKELARSIGRARNVVLCEFLKRENVPVSGNDGNSLGSATVVRLVPPIPLLADAAVATAPFPLPRIPVKVSRYWAFDTQAGETPTLPVVAFHVYSPRSVERFFRLTEGDGGDGGGHSLSGRGLKESIRNARDAFSESPDRAGKLLGSLAAGNTLPGDEPTTRIMRSLIGLYGGGNERYLNYYGPPGTIDTVPYHRMLGSDAGDGRGDPLPDLGGKAVFVGLSDLLDRDEKDAHYSVYSRPDGLDLSGIEIAATAFANLLEDLPVRPLRPPFALVAVFLWGAAAGMTCRLLAPLRAALFLAALGALYLAVAAVRFRTAGVWHPLVIPLLFQSSLGYVGAVLSRYAEAKRERRAIRKAFEYYLPPEVIDRLSEDAMGVRAERRMVFGICMSTDAENYTARAEALAPGELASFMNSYYESVFRHVKRHGGIVSNVVADSMLALWVTARRDEAHGGKALLAALDIAGEESDGSGSRRSPPLVTRVGLSAGDIVIGNVGAADHFEYRPIGDIVNTASRIDGLNKRLGTRILATDEVIRGLDGFLTREIGTFLLVGKSKPVTVHEVICREESSHARRKESCALFAAGLDAFRKGAWESAIGRFREAAGNSGGDAASAFYIGLCGRYMANSPGDAWDGVVPMDTK